MAAVNKRAIVDRGTHTPGFDLQTTNTLPKVIHVDLVSTLTFLESAALSFFWRIKALNPKKVDAETWKWFEEVVVTAVNKQSISGNGKACMNPTVGQRECRGGEEDESLEAIRHTQGVKEGASTTRSWVSMSRRDDTGFMRWVQVGVDEAGAISSRQGISNLTSLIQFHWGVLPLLLSRCLISE